MKDHYSFFISYPDKELFVQEFDKLITRKEAVALICKQSLDYIYHHCGQIGLFCNGKKVRLTVNDYNECTEWEKQRIRLFDCCIYAEYLF